MLRDPLGDRVGLLDRGRVLRFGRETVVREHHRSVRADRELADQPVVGVCVAEHPARAVNVDDHRQRSGGAARAQHPHRHRARRAARHGHVGDVDLRRRDLAGLNLVHDFAALVRAEVKQVRGVGGRVGELLGGRLEHRLAGHGTLLGSLPGDGRVCRYVE